MKGDEDMAVWLVRLDKTGDCEDLALAQGLVIVGWTEVPDLSSTRSRDEVMHLCQAAYPKKPAGTIAHWSRQLWTFKERIQQGDLVIVPLRKRSGFAIGSVVGPYEYRHDLPGSACHVRPAKWINMLISRSAFDPDLLASLGSIATISQIERNQAEQRIRGLLFSLGSP